MAEMNYSLTHDFNEKSLETEVKGPLLHIKKGKIIVAALHGEYILRKEKIKTSGKRP